MPRYIPRRYNFINRISDRLNVSKWYVDVLINPSWTPTKVILMGMGGFSTATTFLSGFSTWITIIISTKVVNTMIFENVPEFVIYIAIAFGVVATVVLQYFIDYEEYMRKKDEAIKFSAKYVVAGVCTAVTAVFVSYIICFFGLDLSGKTIDNCGLAFIVCAAVSAVATYVVDAWLYHRIVDGTALRLWNKGQEAIREAAEQAAKDEELKALVFRTVADKCKAAGLVDEEKIAMIAECITDPEKQEATLDALIKAYKAKA